MAVAAKAQARFEKCKERKREADGDDEERNALAEGDGGRSFFRGGFQRYSLGTEQTLSSIFLKIKEVRLQSAALQLQRYFTTFLS